MKKMLKTMQIYLKNVFFEILLFFAIFLFFWKFIKTWVKNWVATWYMLFLLLFILCVVYKTRLCFSFFYVRFGPHYFDCYLFYLN
jgi:hypothetical protein